MVANEQWFANPSSRHEIDNSCLYNIGDNPKLSRTMAEGDRRQATFSFWIKRSGLGTLQSLFESGGAFEVIRFTAADQLIVRNNNNDVTTNRVFRDVSAWYHIVVTLDNDQGTASNRTRIFVNGVEETSFASAAYPASGDFTDLNDNGKLFQFGAANTHTTPTNEFDGYFAEFNYLDGTAVTNTSLFAETNSNGIYVPIKTSLTYGTNGMQLLFGDSSALGDDTSGEGNDLTSGGLTAADQVSDSPTNNAAILNILDQNGTGNIGTFSEGNTKLVTSANDTLVGGSIPVIEDGCYWEAKVTSAGTEMFGLWVASTTPLRAASTSSPHSDDASCVLRIDEPAFYNEGSATSYTAGTISDDDILQLAYKNGKLWYGRNNTYEKSGDPAGDSGEFFTIANSSSKVIIPVFGRSGGTNVTYEVRFRSEEWEYSAPTGFKELNVNSLSSPAISDASEYFQTTIYTGDGSTQAVTHDGNSDLQPDLTWIKNRDATDSHILTDSVRGVTKIISADANSAQATDTDTLTTFGSDGFTVGADDKVNTNTEKYVSWNFKESATSGFDIVSYTGNATARTISHSLGAVPQVMMVKNLADSDNWCVYHASMASDPQTDFLSLNTNSNITDDNTVWNDTAPTSSVFTVGTSSLTNGNTEAMIAYLFTEVAGFSRFGKFIGNGNNNGPFVHTGHSPSFIIIKELASDDWVIYDTKRNPRNVSQSTLRVDTSAVEFTGATRAIDILSNGFKLRTSNATINSSGSFIFMSWADAPFKLANAR